MLVAGSFLGSFYFEEGDTFLLLKGISMNRDAVIVQDGGATNICAIAMNSQGNVVVKAALLHAISVRGECL
ncbi:MAG TPA: hypothetical protein VJY31_18035 [Buttiauxella sp.]|nr:hypothetical protein [Buttiauxella sp.]